MDFYEMPFDSFSDLAALRKRVSELEEQVREMRDILLRLRNEACKATESVQLSEIDDGVLRR